jgi:hypothetical protein
VTPLSVLKISFSRGCRYRKEALHTDRIPGVVSVLPVSECGRRRCIHTSRSLFDCRLPQDTPFPAICHTSNIAQRTSEYSQESESALQEAEREIHFANGSEPLQRLANVSLTPVSAVTFLYERMRDADFDTLDWVGAPGCLFMVS